MTYGTPVPENLIPAEKTAVLRSVALGFSTAAEPNQLPGGVSSSGTNFITMDGGLSRRPVLSFLSRTSTLGGTIGGGWVGEAIDGAGSRYPAFLQPVGAGRQFGGSWSTLSQVGAAGLSANTLGSVAGTPPFDAVSYYHPTSDEYELCFVTSGASGPWTWRAASGNTLFSVLTNAPQARYVTYFDNRLVFSNISSQGTSYPQRVQWSSRGDPETYTSPNGGFEELLNAKGATTRIMQDGDRLIVFFDGEIWAGYKAPFPFTFQFQPLALGIGMLPSCSWSAAYTPLGIVFLGADLDLYLIPRGGGPQSIGKDLQRYLRDTIDPAAMVLDMIGSNGLGVTGEYDAERKGYWLLWPSKTINFFNRRDTHGIFVSLEAPFTYSPVRFKHAGSDSASYSWRINRLGTTSASSVAGASTNSVGTPRLLAVDSGISQGGNVLSSNVFELSNGTVDFGATSLARVVDCQRLVTLPPEDPSERLFVREVRLQYREASASSVTLRMTGDFFNSVNSIARAVALPTVELSAQTVLAGGVSGQYLGFELQASSAASKTVIQGLSALVEKMGRG